MADPEGPRLNIFAFTIERDETDGIHIENGLAVSSSPEGSFIDVRRSLWLPPPEHLGLRLGLDSEAGKHARLHGNGSLFEGSLALEDNHPFYNLRTHDTDTIIGRPRENAIGYAALVAMSDNVHDFTFLKPTGTASRTRVLESSANGSTGTTLLIMLTKGRGFTVASGHGRLTRIFTVDLYPELSTIKALEQEDSGPMGNGLDEENEGDSGSDREPIDPRKPAGSAGASVEFPPEQQEERLRAVGMHIDSNCE